MILWLDKDFEPLTTEDTYWCRDGREAAFVFLMGINVDMVDADDADDCVQFFQFLDENKIIHLVKRFNIHGLRINDSNRRKIAEILNKHNAFVTYNVYDFTKLKKAQDDSNYNLPFN